MNGSGFGPFAGQASFSLLPQQVANVELTDLTPTPPQKFGNSIDNGGNEQGLIFTAWTPLSTTFSAPGVAPSDEVAVLLWDLGTGQTCTACGAPPQLDHCSISFQNEHVFYAAPALNVTTFVSLWVADQFGKGFNAPSAVTYQSGSAFPGLPAGSRTIYGGDTFVNVVTVPGLYPITANVTFPAAAGAATPQTTSCTATLTVPPVFSQLTSSARNSFGGLLPVASTNGGDVLSLTGQGLSQAQAVTIGPSVRSPVRVTIPSTQFSISGDSAIVLTTPILSQLGLNPGLVPVTITVNGVESNPIDVYLLSPDVPIITTTPGDPLFGPTPLTCSVPTKFQISAYVVDTNLAPIPNASMNVSVDGTAGTLTTDGAGNAGLYNGLWQRLTPPASAGLPYQVTVTFAGNAATATMGADRGTTRSRAASTRLAAATARFLRSRR